MGFPKALLEFQGETFLDRLIAAFSEHCSPVVAVLGARADEIRAGARRGAQFVINESYPLGQITSLQCGLRSVPEDAEGVLFTLVDHPVVARSTIAALLARPRAEVAIPQYRARHGHPVFFDRKLIPELLALDAGTPAKAVFQRHEARYIQVDDSGVLTDIDDPEAYRRLVEP
jgi:CTP:molybdopterin cytidylyltransferase MocA